MDLAPRVSRSRSSAATLPTEVRRAACKADDPTAVPEHDSRISRKPAAFRALHRRSAERGPELLVAHGEEIARKRPRILVANRSSRGKRRFPQLARELDVVRANVLADVAAIDVRPDCLMKFSRNLSLQFDREIRDAACGVQYARLDERVGWARVQTPRTAAATIRIER